MNFFNKHDCNLRVLGKKQMTSDAIAVLNRPIFYWFLGQAIAGFSLMSLNSCSAPLSNPPQNVGSQIPSQQTPKSDSKVVSAGQLPGSKAPITVEKLKNAEYFFLAKGPIKLKNGTYEDPQTKRVYALDEVVTYGDLNKDGIKDAVGSLKVTIPNSGNFSYLVATVNQDGVVKNVSAEFLGERVKVKSITIKPDASIDVEIEQYRPGDPDCCPSIGLSRTYKLRSNQPSPSPQQSPQK
jgi:hypothetical protein